MIQPKNAAIFESYSGIHDYANESSMGSNAVRATDAEIVATATLLQTYVFEYTSYANKARGLKYGKLFTLPDVHAFDGSI